MPPIKNLKMLIGALDTLRHAIEVIDATSIQIALVVGDDKSLIGTVTDGDIRRGLLRGVSLDDTVNKVMNAHPVTAQAGTPRKELIDLMASRSVKQVPLLDSQGRVTSLERIDHLQKGPTVKDNPVVILAGGQGTRLRPLTENTPKPLLTVGSQPMLELILLQLMAHGFHRFFISVNYLGSQIEEYLGDGKRFGVSIEYLREPKPLGTAGPLALAPNPSELPCIVVNGDLLTRVNFDRMLEFHIEGAAHLTVGVKEHLVQLPFGVVITQNERVIEFLEKPEDTHIINAGVYVVNPDIVDLVPKDSFYNMNELIDKALGLPDKPINAFLIHEYWMDIGTAPDYQQAQWDFPVHFTQLNRNQD